MSGGILFLSLICVGIIVVAAIAAIILLLEQDRKSQPKKEAQHKTAPSTIKESVKATGIQWSFWFPVLGIALLLGIWSFWISLLFLFTAWLLRQNPGENATYEIGENEKKTAKRVYNWLFWSPIITVPAFINAYDFVFYEFDGTRVLAAAALLPLIFHAPLLFGLTSRSAFVYRHTQQGILLIALRAGMAAFFASFGDDFLPILFFFGNGSLWLFGTFWGRSQVVRGEAWLAIRKGETINLSNGTVASQSATIHLEKSRAFIQQYKKNEAYTHALAAFRAGDREIKQQAVQLLETLDEVEQF